MSASLIFPAVLHCFWPVFRDLLDLVLLAFLAAHSRSALVGETLFPLDWIALRCRKPAKRTRNWWFWVVPGRRRSGCWSSSCRRGKCWCWLGSTSQRALLVASRRLSAFDSSVRSSRRGLLEDLYEWASAFRIQTRNRFGKRRACGWLNWLANTPAHAETSGEVVGRSASWGPGRATSKHRSRRVHAGSGEAFEELLDPGFVRHRSGPHPARVRAAHSWGNIPSLRRLLAFARWPP